LAVVQAGQGGRGLERLVQPSLQIAVNIGSPTYSECPLYQLFYEGEEPPKLPNLPKRKSSNDVASGSVGKEARYLNKLRRLLSKSDETDRKLLLQMAQKMALRHPRTSATVQVSRLLHTGPIPGLTGYDFSAILAA
jgi:hypothetical protein